MTKKKRVFISHPFANDPVGNMESVDKICKELDKQNILPISPLHLFSYKTEDTDREMILSMCEDIIKLCDEVWLYGESSGCLFERDVAIENGIVVRHKFKKRRC